MNASTTPLLNGFDPATVSAAAEQLAADPSLAVATFAVSTEWRDGSRVSCRTRPLVLGDQRIPRGHTIECDEPHTLFGTDEAANPAELLLSALGSCVAITCAANGAMMGIAIRSLRVETQGTLDLRGALGVDESIAAGFPGLSCLVHIDCDASAEQLAELMASIPQTSPIVDSVARAVGLRPELAPR